MLEEVVALVLAATATGQGLTLVHFSAQTETFLSLKPPNTPYNSHKKVLKSSRKVDECKPLRRGVRWDREQPSLHPFARHARVATRGEAVQVEPMKSKLTPPGTKRLKVKYDNLL